MFPPKALDAKENGAVLGTTRILNGNAVILPFPEPEKTSPSRYVVLTSSFKAGPWVSKVGHWGPSDTQAFHHGWEPTWTWSPRIRCSWGQYSISNLTQTHWAHGRTDVALNNVIFQTKSDRFIRLMVDSFLTVFLRSVVFRPVNFQQFGASRSREVTIFPKGLRGYAQFDLQKRTGLKPWKTMINTGDVVFKTGRKRRK